jgi:hypothetical protein
MKRSEASGPQKRHPKLSPSTTSWIEPRPTHLIQYVFLWRAESERGLDEGRKTKDKAVPCQIPGQLRVIVPPLTTRDYYPGFTVAIPPKVRAHLGLDDRSRVVWNDLNEFAWVGPDVRGTPDSGPFIGNVPEALSRRIIDNVVAARIDPTHRSE